MQPLQDLLARIRWDAKFGEGAFALGYYDRITEREELVPLTSVSLGSQRPGMFAIHDEDGIVRHIPLHRVRTVYKNGIAIWQRPDARQRD